MKANCGLVVCALLAATLSGCGGLSGYSAVAIPRVIDPKPGETPSEVLETLINRDGAALAIQFCEAAEATGDCIKANTSPSATGIGGLFLPLKMELKTIALESYDASRDSFVAKVDAPVNLVPPVCGKVNGRIERDAQGEALRIKIPSFYCNWAGIGNVLTKMTFSIRDIDRERGAFNGFYKIEFYGTGNATGSGFFRAEMKTDQA